MHISAQQKKAGFIGRNDVTHQPNKRYAWAFVCLYVMLILLSSCTEATETNHRGWELRFADDFNERNELGANWKVLDGTWSIKNSRLVCSHGSLLCAKEFEGSQRVEFDAVSSNPCDITAMLGINEAGYESGYFFGFGTDNNTCTRLLVKGKRVKQVAKTIVPGKMHHIVCQRDGLDLSLTVDGENVFSHQADRPLVGPKHRNIGFYIYLDAEIDNVKVYTKPDLPEVLALQDKPEEKPKVISNPNLISNGSFEMPRVGLSTMPDKWSYRIYHRQDNGQLITDPTRAHRGLRYVSLSSTDGEGIKLDALGGLILEPGKTYDISLWARTEGCESAQLLVEPGKGRALVTDKWKQYLFMYAFPKDAKPELGLFIRVKGGTVAVDDVSMVPQGTKAAWPAELDADRSKVKEAVTDLKWPVSAADSKWQSRIPITVSEVMGTAAERYLVSLKLCDILNAVSYDKLFSENFEVVDGGTVKHQTPWMLLDSDKFSRPSAEDEIVFLASCPANTTKTYFIYFAPETRSPKKSLPSELSLALAMPSRYQYKLDCQIGQIQNRADVECSVKGKRLNADICAFAGENVTAELVSPDEMTQIELPLTPDKDRSFHWMVKDFVLPVDTVDGVWKLTVHVDEGNGRNAEAVGTFVVGSAMWWECNAGRINPGDTPKYGADWIKIASASNERESFQLAIGGVKPLKAVKLTASELVRRDGKANIDSSNFQFDFIEKIYVSLPTQEGSRAGWYYDPLVPWRQRDIAAGGFETAWVTVTVDENTAAGEYWGSVIATSTDGTKIEIPITLEVFDFTLPRQKHFTPVLGGDMCMKPTLGYKEPEPGQTNYYRDISNGVGVMALAQLLAEHYATPFYYHHDKSPYAVPWHYDPETGQAEFDFTRLDKNAKIMLENWGQAYLFFGGKFAGGWENPGSVWDWSRDLKRAWSAYWEEAVHEHKARLDTEEGLRMYQAYCRGIAEHLEKKGWLDNAYIYLVDEDKSPEVRQAARKKAETIKKAHPKLKSFVLSNASYRWASYMDLTDAFGGNISAEHLARLRKNGSQWWGTYNRGGVVTSPLSFTRILGAKSWFEGVNAYVNWQICRIPDSLVDGNHYYYVAANAGYETYDFIKSVGLWGSLGTWVYPWPEWEPLPKDASQNLFVSSLRMQALRESVEDYEYLRILSEYIPKMKVDAQGFTPGETLLQKMDNLIEESNVKILKFEYFDVDGKEYHSLRREIGRLIGSKIQ
ncbi:MAG: hypothetical protein ABIG61_04090 [Planctomycetota bacterium]